MQRDLWEVDNHFACMEKNLMVLDGVFMNAKDIIKRQHVFDLPPGIDKATQTHALVAK